MTNLTVVTEFILMGFSANQAMYILHSVLFSLSYLCALMGNILIIMITTLDQYLHTPMYFFLKNLSFLDLCLISVTIPKSIINSLTQNNSISFFGCVAQVFLVLFSAAAELFLLTVMSFDRYAAICHPLHYDVIMNRVMCLHMAAVSWLGGGMIAVMHTAGTFSILSFCKSNIIHQFFCDIPQLLAISCSENLLREILPILISVVIDFCCFIFIIFSYIYIFSTVKKIPSTEGQSKAYSTCFPHLAVVVLFLSTGFIAYLKPTSESPSISDLIITVFYTIVPPTFNPIIYSLRNKAMKKALGMLIKGKLNKK
ncbi:LOW QUALITY PROTEIN: olfactory receptor 14A16-like [Orycteropus afer afer]|uniref:LOW QUALITY PROTEIN: olfactory receptor 14A16-like n=1 Tax=Orycteropus afer afer TaxID=1230840 RepID=A0AC54Z7B5_ORYAF|nr:LOW QUALITY PROTEIN: olfactory receptor 14A16-like [Orycteropus afer afer]